MNKTGKTSVVTIIVIGVIAIIALNYLGVINVASIINGQGAQDTGVGVTASTPSVDFNCVDMHNPQTGVSCNVFYKVNGGSVSSSSDGTGVLLSVGDSVEYLANASGFYSVHGTFTVPNKNTHDVDVKMLQIDNSPSIKIYNEDDSLLNSATNTEALGANADDDQKVEVISSYKDGIMGATFVVDYLKTNIDDITSSLGADIQEPDYLTHNTSAGRTAPDTFASFALGDLNAGSGDKDSKEFILTIDTGSTAYGKANMTVGIIDKDWYRDANGGFSYGFEEPDQNTDVGRTGVIAPTLFVTASS